LAFTLNILVGKCLQIDLDGGNMIKFWSIEHEIFDLFETNDDLLFKELINFTIFMDHARVSGDGEFTDLTDAEVMKSVLDYRVLGF
jgi:hypothetical protein